jgi:hypothetical protein
MRCNTLCRGLAEDLEVIGLKPGPFANSRQHSRSDFLGVVKSEDVVGPAFTAQDTMGSGVASDGPADS